MTNHIKTKSDEQALLQGYYYDSAEGNKIIKFVEAHVWLEGKPLRLQNWQKEFFHQVFSWRAEDGSLRWKKISAWIPKKNGKSFLGAIILIIRLIQSERDTMHYSCATSLSQAGIVFGDVRNIIAGSPNLKDQFKIYDNPGRREIIYIKKNTRYRLISSKKDGADGIKSTTFLEDELHLITDDYHKIVSGSTTGIRNSLHFLISTAGAEANDSFCGYREYSLAKKIIKGSIIDVTLLPIIYEALETDDLKILLDMKTALLANPRAREDDTLKDSLAELIQYYKEYPEKINEYSRYHLNLWRNENEGSWICPQRYSKLVLQKAPDIKSDTPCWIGVDLSKTTDLTAISLLFELGDDQFFERHLALIPEDRVEYLSQIDKVDYATWISQGHIQTCGSEAIEDDHVASVILDLTRKHNVKGVGIDSWNGRNLAQLLQSQGVDEVALIPQYNRYLSPLIKMYEQWILLGKIRHERNPVYDWQLANAITVADMYGNLKLAKSSGTKKRKRIDSCDAIIDALYLRYLQQQEQQEQRNQAANISIY